MSSSTSTAPDAVETGELGHPKKGDNDGSDQETPGDKIAPKPGDAPQDAGLHGSFEGSSGSSGLPNTNSTANNTSKASGPTYKMGINS